MIEKLEPAAVKMGAQLGDPRQGTPEEGMAIAIISAAISLKRIADLLEYGGLPAHFFEQAAYNAGISFANGQRR